jgi:hypothetical protein
LNVAYRSEVKMSVQEKIFTREDIMDASFDFGDVDKQ